MKTSQADDDEVRAVVSPSGFWTDANRAKLHSWLSEICDFESYSLSPENFWEETAELCERSGLRARKGYNRQSSAWIPGKGAFRKYCEKCGTAAAPGFQGDRRFLNALAVIARRKHRDGISAKGQDAAFLADFWKSITTKTVSQPEHSDAAAKTAISGLFSAMGTQRNLIDPAAESFFGSGFRLDQAEKRRYFETYRFSATPGLVDKSFTMVASPSFQKHFVDFKNFYSDGLGNRRLVSGMALQFQHGTFLLGVIGDGVALKTIYLSNVSHTESSLVGGTMSTSGAMVLAARILMRETRVADSRELVDAGRLEVGPHPVALIKAELGDSINAIRNVLRSQMERDVHMREGKQYRKVEQRRMVTEVAKVLDAGGESLFIHADDRSPFNPADDQHYTFNSALDLE